MFIVRFIQVWRSSYAQCMLRFTNLKTEDSLWKRARRLTEKFKQKNASVVISKHHHGQDFPCLNLMNY